MDIRVEQLGFAIDNKRILTDVSFKAPRGSTVALIGASGSGKTTLLNCIGLLLTSSAGHIYFDGRDVTKASDRHKGRLWESDLSFIFQDYGLIDDETVAANVTLGRTPLFRKKKISHNPRLESALSDVGLPDREGDFVTKLSGGERQRVGIARALYKQASLILADEPTASLDRANRAHIQNLLLGAATRGATVVVATHDETLASVCDVVVQLDTVTAAR